MARGARQIHQGPPLMRPEQAKPIQQRILDRVEEQEDGCWLWEGRSFTKAGHGRMYVGSRTDGSRRNASVHRLMWEETRGAIPDDLAVLHTCDVANCVNPDHLFLGTQAENMADRDRKGRQARGSLQGLAKLTADKVRTMRRAFHKYDIPIADMARRYGVTYQAARAAISRPSARPPWASSRSLAPRRAVSR
jgi:hypothetical protein